ncbi:MAG: FAD-dependent oxidoreductase, partial [Candidatus Eremiobacterota bacterium]
MQVLIIGGGPGGLALGFELGRRGVDYLILERAPWLGNTFRTMAANTTYGPWINNVLPCTRPSWNIALRRTNREEYAQYLSEYAIRNDLRYRTGIEVQGIQRGPDGFQVRTDQGEFRARSVVNATGYFSNPFRPVYPGAAESCIRQIHAAAFRDPDTVRCLVGRNRARVLLVGKRMTAGEVMQSLYRAGFLVWISHRSPIRYGPSSFMEACLSPFTFMLEKTLRHVPGLPEPRHMTYLMCGGEPRRLIESG